MRTLALARSLLFAELVDLRAPLFSGVHDVDDDGPARGVRRRDG